MNEKYVTCTAWDLLGKHYDDTHTHHIRIVGGRALYEEARNVPSGNVLLYRIEPDDGGLKIVKRLVEPDTLVELVPYPAPVVKSCAIRQSVSIAVEMPSVARKTSPVSELAQSSATLPTDAPKQAVLAPLPKRVMILNCEDPHKEAADQRRAEYRQRRLWEDYDTGKLEARDFCPEMPPAKPESKAERQHHYDGRFYGSYSYYRRNR